MILTIALINENYYYRIIISIESWSIVLDISVHSINNEHFINFCYKKIHIDAIDESLLILILS